MLIYKSRVFDLYSTNVSSRKVPFEYVGHRGSCAALLVDPNDEIGLLAHDRPAIGRTLFELPAGTLDYERPTDEIMRNEIKEECEIEVRLEQLKRLTALYPSPGYTSEQQTLYLVRVTTEQRKQSEALRWFSLRELNKLIREEEITDMKTVLAITAYQAILWKGANNEAL